MHKNKKTFSSLLFSVDISCNAVLSSNTSNNYACEDAEFYCPSNGLCNIDCVTPDSCYNTQIFIPNRRYDTLNLYCDPTQSGACSGTDINCIYDSTQSTMTFGTNTWTCGIDYECCPFKTANITCAPSTNCKV